MNLQNKKKKLSIRVVIHPCKASAAGVYSLAIRVLYRRKKKEYSLGWRVHESNYRRDADRVVYSSEGILTREGSEPRQPSYQERERRPCQELPSAGENRSRLYAGAPHAETPEGAVRPECG